MAVVLFEELSHIELDSKPVSNDDVWLLGGGVDLLDVVGVGIFQDATPNHNARFIISFKASEPMVVEAERGRKVLHLHDRLNKIWLLYSRRSSACPIATFNRKMEKSK